MSDTKTPEEDDFSLLFFAEWDKSKEEAVERVNVGCVSGAEGVCLCV